MSFTLKTLMYFRILFLRKGRSQLLLKMLLSGKNSVCS